MNPLVILPLLAAACLAAPAPGLVAAPGGLVLAGAPLVQTLQTVQVPLTKTVHYDVKNVVTGYSTSILKPALGVPQVGLVPQVAAPAVVAAPAPGQNLFTFQLPGGDQNPINNIPGAPGGPPAPQPDANNPPQVPGQQPPPQIPGFPEFPQLPGQSTTAKPDAAASPNDPGNGETQTQNPVLIPGFPAFPSFPSTNVQNLFNIAAPAPVEIQAPVQQEVVEVQQQNDDTDTITVEARSAVQAAPAPAVATVQVVPQTLAAPALTLSAIPAPAAPVRLEAFRPTPPFDQLVTKQAVLAPGRTNTQITPQVTQVQPEVTVRRVIQDVPVATPVIAQAQPLALAAAPAFTRFVSAGPGALTFANQPLQVNGFNVVV